MIVSDTQLVSVHTLSGVQVYQYLPSEVSEMVWGREAVEVSRCEISAASTDPTPEIVPWVHWVSVWNDQGTDLYWTGPVTKVTYQRERVRISARDAAALAARTRCPITKSWESADPAEIAAELWAAMADVHGLTALPVVRLDPLGDRFNFTTTADTTMLDKVFDELVELGLSWSVVCGVPLLGPAPRTPMAALGEDDFVGEGLSLVRDGTRTYTDVVVRGANATTRARTNTAGLNLQTLVDVNSLFGLSNADHAARQYLRYTSRLRDAVTVDNNSRLHHDAPVDIDTLIPTTRVTVEGFGIITEMELTSVEVAMGTSETEVSVTLESVDDDPPELLDAADGGDL